MPARTIEAVEIMLRISFWAVPDFSRVEPVSTSGPTSTSMARSAALPTALPGLQAMAAVADAQKTVARMTSKDYASGIGKFDKMEARIQAQLDESTAAMELSEAPTNEADELAAKYAGGGADVDADLAALKAEMGMAPTDASVEDELTALKESVGG